MFRREETEPVIAACRAHGLSVTPQRIAIFRCLAASAAHPSAEVVHAELRREMPTISLATVYKNLEMLAAVGAIRPLTYMRGRMRYDADLTPHHHVVCTRCNVVEDVRDKRLDDAGRPARAAAARHGFSMNGHAVEIWGLCRDCGERAA